MKQEDQLAKFTTQIEEELCYTTDLEGLSTALTENPSKFAHYAFREIRAKSEADKADENVRRVEGELYAKVQHKLRAFIGKEPTVDAIRSGLRTEAKFIEASDAARAAREKADLLMVARQSFSQRMYSVIETSKLVRSEIEAGMAPKTQKARVEKAHKELSEFFERKGVKV